MRQRQSTSGQESLKTSDHSETWKKGSPDSLHETDFSLGKHTASFHYKIEARFDSSNLIDVVAYKKGAFVKSPYFSQTEIDYLMAVTAPGKVFKEVPNTIDNHSVAGLCVSDQSKPASNNRN